MDKKALSLPTGVTKVEWIIKDYLSHMCNITMSVKGYRLLYHTIRLCHDQPVYLEQDNEQKLLEELRDLVAAERDDMKNMKISQVKGYMESAIDRAWKRRLRISSGQYPTCPLTLNDFLSRSLEALSMEGPYWKRELVLWRYKDE